MLKNLTNIFPLFLYLFAYLNYSTDINWLSLWHLWSNTYGNLVEWQDCKVDLMYFLLHFLFFIRPLHSLDSLQTPNFCGKHEIPFPFRETESDAWRTVRSEIILTPTYVYEWNHPVPCCQCDVLMFVAFSVKLFKPFLSLSSLGPSCFGG